MIRPATPDDVDAIVGLIRGLADYEHLTHLVEITPARLRAHRFAQRPLAEALVACADGGRVVGFALFFPTYSTFLGKPGIWLEDLYVDPAERGRGHGKALIATIAALAVERGCGRFEWSALDWNAPAIGFYRALGASGLDDWTVQSLEGDALRSLAAHDAL